jgi:hypothetical protein
MNELEWTEVIIVGYRLSFDDDGSGEGARIDECQNCVIFGGVAL